jgi:hypothetical protein
MKLTHGWHHALKIVTAGRRCDNGGNGKANSLLWKPPAGRFPEEKQGMSYPAQFSQGGIIGLLLLLQGAR